MSNMLNEELLRLVAASGEIRVQDLAAKVKRTKGDYTDFYGLSALLHAGYISTDTTTDSGGEKVRGTLGITAKDTAVSLCQLVLPAGEKFYIHGCSRDSWHDVEILAFITAAGALKLEELDGRAADEKRRRVDYAITIFIALLAAIVGGWAGSYFESWKSDDAPKVESSEAA